MTTSLINIIAPYFAPYLEMTALTGELYCFRKASTALRDGKGERRLWHPKIQHRMLRGYHRPKEGILYAAFPAVASPLQLGPEDLLYIGCSASGGSRFWRGRQNETAKFLEPKSCFHHEQMRRGRNGSNLEHYLEQIGSIMLYTMSDTDVAEIVRKHHLRLPEGKYPAHQLEKAILAEGFSSWKWNARS